MVRLKLHENTKINLTFWGGATREISMQNSQTILSNNGNFSDYIMFPCLANQSTVTFAMSKANVSQSDNSTNDVFQFEVESFITGCVYYDEGTSVWLTDGCWVRRFKFFFKSFLYRLLFYCIILGVPKTTSNLINIH